MVAVWAHGTSVVPFPTHLVEGWRWALTKRNFLSAIILGAIVNIACVASITGAQIMLAARGANAVMIGLLGTAMGVSTLVGSLLANKLVDMVPTGKLIAGALTLFVVSQMPLAIPAQLRGHSDLPDSGRPAVPRVERWPAGLSLRQDTRQHAGAGFCRI